MHVGLLEKIPAKGQRLEWHDGQLQKVRKPLFDGQWGVISVI